MHLGFGCQDSIRIDAKLLQASANDPLVRRGDRPDFAPLLLQSSNQIHHLGENPAREGGGHELARRRHHGRFSEALVHANHLSAHVLFGDFA